ncbi:hypothetical protein [Brevibacillus centrosporus]|uniref:Uncharacterized protein n=1 Tax=Brevibacillus centrosporus TaxID=54910 RepID=A0A1I4AYD0_9BACL|nr:hypothetical protein [Brevibacillus centrosporus]SFK61515.1 hypothetical protein SAMN05518846_11672 [Brevibacillus centrosporus]
MGKRKNRVFIVIALIVLAAAGFAGSRLLGGVSVAEGYVHEEENRIIFAKVVIPYADQTRVEVVDNFVETQDSIPVLKSETYNYTGTMDGEKLTLQSQSGGAMEATVSAGELVFQSPLQEGGQVPAKLLASTPVQYQKQLETMTNRINEQAEVKKKEVAEKQAKEKERVEFAKKVEKTDRLAADLVENAQYLTDLQFPDEAAVYQSHVSELQGLLDEIKLYAGQPALQMTEYEVMKETAGAMKVLVDGMSSMNDSIQDKKKRMADITGVLETDLKDIKATWGEIKAKAPKPEERQKAVDAAVKAAQEAIEQAKKRISSIEAERDTASQKADKLYGEANAFLSKVKPK